MNTRRRALSWRLPETGTDMLACCAFAIVLLAPLIAMWRRGRQRVRRWLGLPLEPDNAAVAWAPAGPAPALAAAAASRRPVRIVWILAAAVAAVAVIALAHAFFHHPAHAGTATGSAVPVLPDSFCLTLP